MISKEDLDKIAEISRLHDEAFWHLHKFDSHAKSSDGSIRIEVNFGNVWNREETPVEPSVSVSIYSYVVASSTPSYPNFGERNHYFETVDEALKVMTEWHAQAMKYNPTEEDLLEMDNFAAEMWDLVKDRTTVMEIIDGEPVQVWPPKRFRDKANGE
jgi:hypothetical protein